MERVLEGMKALFRLSAVSLNAFSYLLHALIWLWQSYYKGGVWTLKKH